MKNVMVWFLAVLLGFTMVAGCSTLQKGVTVPTGCEKSLIYNNVPYADLAGGIVTIAGLEAFKVLKEKGVVMEPVMVTLQNLDAALDNPTLTYTGFVAVMAQTNEYVEKYAGIELVFLSGVVESLFKDNVSIDPCDRDYLHKQVNNAIMLLKLQ